jgi:hypothetical protein
MVKAPIINRLFPFYTETEGLFAGNSGKSPTRDMFRADHPALEIALAETSEQSFVSFLFG